MQNIVHLFRIVLSLFLPFSLLFCSPAPASEWERFPLRDNGSIPVWLVAGPFPNAAPLSHGPGCFGYFKDYLEAGGTEAHCVPSEGDVVAFGEGQQTAWHPAFTDSPGLLDFLDALGAKEGLPGVAYAFCRLDSDSARDVTLKVRSNDGVRLWFNGTLVHDHHVGRTVDDGGEDRVAVSLKQGPNTLLFKVDQSAGAWGLKVALEGVNAQPPTGVVCEVQVAEPLLGTFRSASFSSLPLATKTAEGERQIVRGRIASGGLKDARVRISLRDWPAPRVIEIGDLATGVHEIELPVPVVEQDATARIELESASDHMTLDDVPFERLRRWTIYMVQHTHTDIGYTRPQDELLPDFLRYIDHALDYCDQTEDYPVDAQFRWTCETSWAVREYLRRRPKEQVDRFLGRVAEGRIEVTGLPLNMLELADERITAASLQPIREFREQGIPVSTFMQNDVPGAAWCLVDYGADIGIKYLIMGINNDRTPRPFARPTAFWWESPSGKRILAWRPDHYHAGNRLGIHQGNLEALKRKTMAYLAGLETAEYPFERIALQYSGIQIDNSPPALTGCDLMRAWNEKYAWPHLRSSTAHEFPAYVEAHHASELPVFRAAWPNWWSDAHGFANVETAEARRSHAGLLAAEGMLSIAALLGGDIPPTCYEETARLEEDLLFYDEHTFGAQEEFTNPMAENAAVQWGEKIAHAWNAVKASALLRETAWGALSTRMPRAEVPTLAVVNSLAWKRSGPVHVYIGHEVQPAETPCRFVDMTSGKDVPARLMSSRFEGSYWTLWVEDVPPMGYKMLCIDTSQSGEPSQDPKTSSDHTLENTYYRLEVDPESGSLRSLIDKETGRELVDLEGADGLGQFIRDTLTDYHFFDRQSYLDRSTRSGLRNVRVEDLGVGPVWSSLRITAQAEGCIATDNAPGVMCELRLYNEAKLVEMRFTMRKQFVPEPESIYLAFPFAPANATLFFDAQGGIVSPGENQLPGSSTDWNTVQNFVAIRDEKGQTLLSCDEIPLVQFGDINMGKWQYTAAVARPHVYSWVMNNYWTYNFRGSKESEFSWSYFLTSTPDTTNTIATRFGWGSRVPLIAQVNPGGNPVPGSSSASALHVEPANVLLVNCRPAGDGRLLLHLRELEGRQTEASLVCNGVAPASADVVDVLGTPMEAAVSSITLMPFESKFVRITLPDTIAAR
ncbi:MAG: hypothetical protein IT365_29170 [Candidatus Hydrogenedentes bacterium]|nr:hypothetical protein [Candidatus Hydrogenedentota bacterium]